MGRTLRRGLIITLLFASTARMPAAGAAAEGVFAGACTMQLTATFGNRVGIVPGPNGIGIHGGGTCVVNGLVGPLTFNATVATTAITGGYSCAGGVATGTGVVQIEVPGFPDPLVQVTVVASGGVVTIALVWLLVTFEGVAELVQEPVDTATCAVSGITSARWTGAMAFQDPYPPPVR